MNKTKIPWCDWTWNPIVGCSPASEGCENCYAATIAKRFNLAWGSAHFVPDRLCQPATVRQPGRVFVCSMADLWHETVSNNDRLLVLSAMRQAPWHTYILLTKRPQYIEWIAPFPRNWWLGVTVENQARAQERIPILLSIPAAVRFVSVEPMLGLVRFARWAVRWEPDWVIAGPETGPRARRCEDAWIDALAAESRCFFDKRKDWKRREWPGVCGNNAAPQ
jgi:protein gp37